MASSTGKMNNGAIKDRRFRMNFYPNNGYGVDERDKEEK